MRGKIFLSTLAATVLLTVGAISGEEKPLRTALAGQIVLNIQPTGKADETVVIKDRIKVVFLSVEKDENRDENGYPDVDRIIPGQIRYDAVTSSDGYFFIENVDAGKNLQIRRIIFEINGEKRVQNFGYIMSQGPKIIKGVNVLWHRMEANFPGSVSISGNMSEEDKAWVQKMMKADNN